MPGLYGINSPVFPVRDTEPPEHCPRCDEFLDGEGECPNCELTEQAARVRVQHLLKVIARPSPATT